MEPSLALRVWFMKAKGANENSMLYTIAVILIVLWLLGFIAHVGGGLIHLLLVVAVIVIIYRLVTGQRVL
jgi:hypothetical protein